LRILLTACIGALALVACGSSGQSSAPAPTPSPSASASASQPPANAATIVKLADFAIQPASLSVAKGSAVTVDNAGKSPHNLYVSEASGKVLAHTADLAPGQSARLSLDLAPGSYTMYCNEPGHAALGMKGTLQVT
jgi:uncharacterized cupredoxin-like copper-binding protein